MWFCICVGQMRKHTQTHSTSQSDPNSHTKIYTQTQSLKTHSQTHTFTTTHIKSEKTDIHRDTLIVTLIHNLSTTQPSRCQRIYPHHKTPHFTTIYINRYYSRFVQLMKRLWLIRLFFRVPSYRRIVELILNHRSDWDASFFEID